jgi:hypothetical protein
MNGMVYLGLPHQKVLSKSWITPMGEHPTGTPLFPTES